MPKTFERLRSKGTFLWLAAAAFAGVGAALAFGRHFGQAEILVAIVSATAIGVCLFFVWLFLTVLGTRWTLYGSKLIVRRPGARQLQIPRSDISQVRLESVTGFGMVDAIYVFIDTRSGVLLWTVASRWREQDLRELWNRLGIEPVIARAETHPFETLPYDRRY